MDNQRLLATTVGNQEQGRNDQDLGSLFGWFVRDGYSYGREVCVWHKVMADGLQADSWLVGDGSALVILSWPAHD